MKKQIMKLLGAKKTMRGHRVRLLPLFVISLLMMGVAADLIAHYTVDVTTSDGEVLGDPYWTKFTDLAETEVSNVPLPAVTQNDNADTDHYLLSLVNPLTRVSMVYELIGTVNMGVTVECYLEDGAVDILWQEGNNYATLMGDSHPDSVELYWKILASYDAEIGSLGSFGFRFTACENPIIPFALSVDSISQGPKAEFRDVATSTMQTTIDFGTIIPDDPAVINTDYLLYGVGHTLVQYAWTGLPTDVHIAMEWSDNGGTIWNVWDVGVDYDLAYEEELLLRFSITADPGSDHSAGLAVGLVLTEGVAPVVPFLMNAVVTETGATTDMEIMDPTFTTVLTSFDFGTVTQSVPMQYTAGLKCIANSIGPEYTWTISAADVTIVVEYSLNGGSTWIPWTEGAAWGETFMAIDETILVRLTITADADAEYPAGLTLEINFHAG